MESITASHLCISRTGNLINALVASPVKRSPERFFNWSYRIELRCSEALKSHAEIELSIDKIKKKLSRAYFNNIHKLAQDESWRSKFSVFLSSRLSHKEPFQ